MKNKSTTHEAGISWHLSTTMKSDQQPDPLNQKTGEN
jgi:hypothetical protein